MKNGSAEFLFGLCAQKVYLIEPHWTSTGRETPCLLKSRPLYTVVPPSVFFQLTGAAVQPPTTLTALIRLERVSEIPRPAQPCSYSGHVIPLSPRYTMTGQAVMAEMWLWELWKQVDFKSSFLTLLVVLSNMLKNCTKFAWTYSASSGVRSDIDHQSLVFRARSVSCLWLRVELKSLPVPVSIWQFVRHPAAVVCTRPCKRTRNYT